MAAEVEHEDIASGARRDELLQLVLDVPTGWRLGRVGVRVDQDVDVRRLEAVVRRQHRVDGGDIVDTATEGCLGACNGGFRASVIRIADMVCHVSVWWLQVRHGDSVIPTVSAPCTVHGRRTVRLCDAPRAASLAHMMAHGLSLSETKHPEGSVVQLAEATADCLLFTTERTCAAKMPFRELARLVDAEGWRQAGVSYIITHEHDA